MEMIRTEKELPLKYKKVEAITPEFQKDCFKIFWCVLTGIFLTRDLYLGGIMLIVILSLLLVKHNK